MRATTHSSKDARIDLRVSLTQKALLERAAASQGKKLTVFVIGASTEAAQLALADQNRFALSEDQMTKFLASLEEEPKVLPKLRALLATKSAFE